MLRPLLIGVGVVSVALGALGIVLPLLPTTPFLLLAAACFARSSERFHRWLLEHRVFGPYIRDYLQERGLTLRTKITAVGLIAVSMGSAAAFVDVFWGVKVVMLTIGAAVSTHLIRLRTLPPR